jgi:hypothetical protein
MKDRVPRGNGTLCRVLGVKLRENAPSHKVKNYYGKKVWTVNAKHVEWIQCEHVNIPGHMVQLETQIYELEKGQQNQENKTKLERLKELLSKEKKNRIFNLEPEQFSPEVNVKHHHTSTRKQKLCCKMNQIPANSNDATTGHKLQGMSKDIIIVSSWPTGGLSLLFKNWEYVVLSRVRTLSGLYLVEPIDMDKSFNPSPQLRSYMERAMQKEKEILEKRRIAMSQIIW